MTRPEMIDQPTTFTQVDSVTHDGVVIAFGEEWSETTGDRKLWYRVLDLEQTADQDLETVWEDATRWTRWYEVPWPGELRAVGMSLFNVHKMVDHRYATVPGRWKALDDGGHVYLFRALDLTLGAHDGGRVYANRYLLVRLPSPDAGTNRGAKGQEVTVPQLVPVREARYRRSAVRESPLGDTDSQGTRDLGNVAFVEATMEWSMLRPIDGAFTVTLTPSNLPGRMRWQFFCKVERDVESGGVEPAVAAFSILRDDDGWADLEEKFNLLNDDADDRFRVRADAVFRVVHPDLGTLAMDGRPASVTFRLQEQSSPLGRTDSEKQQEQRALSGQRVMLAMRAKPDDDVAQLLATDFGLDEVGAIVVGPSVKASDVDFARSALWLNSPDDRVILSAAGPQQGSAFSVQAWLRHDQGSGTVLSRGWLPETAGGGWSEGAASAEGAASGDPVGWVLEWRADKRLLAGIRVLVTDGGNRVFRVEARLPTSFTWHHVGLVHDDSGLALFVDGVEVARQQIGVDGDGSVAGDIVIGGPATGAGPDGWVDFRIDQVVLRQSAAEPSIDTMYVELDQSGREDADTLGYWTFDRPGPSAAADYQLRGADEVSQTAPLFPSKKGEFEQYLGDMSTGMGLLDVPGWHIDADPHLFVGADGIVRLYTVASGAKVVETAAELVYDTTSTRAQFTARWKATGSESDQEGVLILQAREPGPIMNRAAVQIEETGDTLLLRITHPYREDGFGEVWRELPKELSDLVAVINGQARSKSRGEDPQSADPRPMRRRPQEPSSEAAGPTPRSYDYSNDGPRESSDPYASELVQAIAADLPDNGANAVVQAGASPLRQQGNFTGWTRAPLMVSCRFGGPAAATVGVGSDTLDRLRIPGDFAIEAWIRPVRPQKPTQTTGYTKAPPGTFWRNYLRRREQQRILNWHQSDDDGLSLSALRYRQFALSAGSDEFAGRVLTTTDKEVWFSQGGGFRIKATFQLPEGGQAGSLRALATLITKTGVTLDIGGFFDTLREHRQSKIDETKAGEGAQTSLDTWQPEGGNIRATVGITMRLGLRGRSVVFDVRHNIHALNEADSHIVDLWWKFLKGEKVSPPGARWSVSDPDNAGLAYEFDLIDVPINRAEGEPVQVVVTLDDTKAPPTWKKGWKSKTWQPRIGPRPRITCDIDGELSSVNEAEAEERWLAPFEMPSSASLVVGQAGEVTLEPFTGAIHTIETRLGEGKEKTFSIDFDDPSDTGNLPKGFYSGTLRFAPTLGDRRFEAVRAVTPADWLHVGLVCSNNFAVRFDGTRDRAVIRDAGGLTPDRALTIDCVVVRESNNPGTVISKAIEIGDDRALSFRLSLDAGGYAHLEYSIDVGGSTQIHETRSARPLEPGKPYHLLASVLLEEVYYPERPEMTDGEPTTRYQLWLLHDGVWVYDIARAAWHGDRPRDFKSGLPTDYDFVRLVRLSAASQSQSLVSGYKVLSMRTELDPFFDIRIKATDGPAALGAATGEDPEQLSAGVMNWFEGLLGSARVWRSNLPASSLEKLPLEAGLPSGVEGPTAWWAFDENRGLQAADSTGGMTATLTREEMWVTTRATAKLTLYLNGRAMPLRSVAAEESVDYGDPTQFTIGGSIESGIASETFEGMIDDVRVWRDIRTGEEIIDTMHTRMGGNEDDLAAWWPMSAGIGVLIKDASLGGTNHLKLIGGDDGFWQRQAAPVGDDLPQVRHLLGGLATSWTVTAASVAPMAAEYGDIQTDAEGRIVGVQKRAMVLATAVGTDKSIGAEQGWATATGFKTGDLDLIYVGQAQSDPTLIGYIEGAPPIPSENLTRPYWKSPYAYDSYNDRTTIRLREAENTTTLYGASYDRGFDMAQAHEFLYAFKYSAVFGAGFAMGGFSDVEFEAVKAKMHVGAKATFDLGLGWHRASQTSIGTSHSISSTLGLAGSWEPADRDRILNKEVGRRFVPDNTGYALVKSGVANVYAMRLRRNGAMLGLTMVPDPDIPEDFNIITFKIRSNYTKQGTLDGRIGLMTDPDWAQARPGRGSYFRPLEAANLEAQIDSYEAKLHAAYDTFDAGGYGRRSAGIHFTEDDPAQNPRSVVEGRNVIPHDWETNLSRRNIVNTYVWTASGGFFAEEVGTSIVRSESSGGSYSFKGMLGVRFKGEFAAGAGALTGTTWDTSAMFGGHIQTTVMKTKTDGRDFGLDVKVDCDALLERYTGEPEQLYSGVAEPGKVSSYRFKTFHLVPAKSHFDDFWSRVVDDDWLESDNLDATALRQARGNHNHVWRVLHRVTYVQRVPPSGESPIAAPVQQTKTVVHEGPNWQNIKLALDVLRTGTTSTGQDIGAATHDEQLALAADDLVRRQWRVLSPWWGANVDEFDTDPESTVGLVVAELRRRTYEYLKAYSDTGLLDQDPRYQNPPTPALP